MAIDVNNVAAELLGAFKTSLGPLVGKEEAFAKAQALAFAHTMAAIEADHLAGNLTDDAAQDAIQTATDAAQAGLEADLALGESAAEAAVSAGVNVLVSVALGSAGLGWLQPILTNVLSGMAADGAAKNG